MPEQFTAVNIISILQKCRKKQSLQHAKVFDSSLWDSESDQIGNYIVPMFVECKSLSDSQQVFNNLISRNEHSWTSLILAYAGYGQPERAFSLYEKMKQDHVSPSTHTLVALLRACIMLKDVGKGRQIHFEIREKGFEKDLIIRNVLIDMYAKCGFVWEAQEVFDKYSVRDVVSWTALIAGYVENGLALSALKLYQQMQLERIPPNDITFVCTLKACSIMEDMDKARAIHTEISHRGFEKDLFVGSTLVDVYAKSGLVEEAREVFDKLPIRNVVSWTALIAGYAENGLGQEALECFQQMKFEGLMPNAITFASSLKGCITTAALDMGREIHLEIVQKGFEKDLYVSSTLIDMYAKGGSILEARKVFDKLPRRNLVSWNAMIRGYGMNHESKMAVQCFENMLEQGVKPDAITFMCLLTACSRASLVVKGQEFFNSMQKNYDIVPKIDHYNCIVDLLARSGFLYEAGNLLGTQPSKEAWIVLLSACKTYGETEIGLRCFQQLVQMDAGNAAYYLLMESIYVSAGRWDDADRIAELRKHGEAKEKLEGEQKMHEFVLNHRW